ncbi:hypothetical protein HY249_00235, partial [Candidatus Azambacteria bacterium]|nr:hypothetical protein [Candidatus Azambacteria bacterium]
MLETEEKIDPRNDLAGDEAAARKIAQLGHYDAIVSELEDRGLLESQMQRVQSLADIDFLNEEDWKILTVLELFDRLTFEH